MPISRHISFMSTAHVQAGTGLPRCRARRTGAFMAITVMWQSCGYCTCAACHGLCSVLRQAMLRVARPTSTGDLYPIVVFLEPQQKSHDDCASSHVARLDEGSGHVSEHAHRNGGSDSVVCPRTIVASTCWFVKRPLKMTLVLEVVHGSCEAIAVTSFAVIQALPCVQQASAQHGAQQGEEHGAIEGAA